MRAREPEGRRVINQKARNKASKPKVRHKYPKHKRPGAMHKDPKQGTKVRSKAQRPEARHKGPKPGS
jgi:hypothetical protein